MPFLGVNHKTFSKIKDKTSKKPKLRGFTLIELLVVMAIIGILAGIVLTSLSAARVKAKNARIIGEMYQIRNMAAIYYDNNDYSFAGINCDDDLPSLCDDINTLLGAADQVEVYSDTSAYCAKTPMIGGGWWCVDSKGRSAKYFFSPPLTCTGASISCE